MIKHPKITKLSMQMFIKTICELAKVQSIATFNNLSRNHQSFVKKLNTLGKKTLLKNEWYKLLDEFVGFAKLEKESV